MLIISGFAPTQLFKIFNLSFITWTVEKFIKFYCWSITFRAILDTKIVPQSKQLECCCKVALQLFVLRMRLSLNIR